MQTLSQKLERNLIDFVWSLWTELGVAGVIRKHQQFLIMPEELVLLTSVLTKSDPRLRDEALDWCSKYHHFISISRLRTIANEIGILVSEPYSLFAATLNSVSTAHWPLTASVSPLKFVPSGKTKSPQFENPALLTFRLRSLFGVGARADMLLFFLTQKKNSFAIADTVEIGYTKRNLADILENFVRAGFFTVSPVRNQKRYYFAKQDQLIKIVHPLPTHMPSWRNLLEVILQLRSCIQQMENKSEGVRIVELHNLLQAIEPLLQKLHLRAPPLQTDFSAYWDSFANWVLELSASLASGFLPQQLGAQNA